MSSGSGYSYTYVDVAAQERRRLRADIAALGARAAIAQARARSQSAAAARQLGLDQFSWEPAGANNATLAAQVSELRQAVAVAEQVLDTMAADAWARRPRKRTAVTTATAAEELARGAAGPTMPWTAQAPGMSAPRDYAAPDRDAAGRAAAAAEELLATEAFRCSPDDLEELHRQLVALRSLERADEARRAFTELESAVRRSISHRRRDEEAAIARASLLARAQDALDEDRGNLIAVLSTAPDPAALTGLVDTALERADRRRQRAAVAVAAAAALADIGADVGEDFVTMLTARGETAVRLGPGFDDGYGLLVSLPEGKAELSTVVVRHPAAPTDPDDDRQAARDQAAQQLFCDEGLERLEEQVGRGAVRLHRLFRREPGQRDVRPVPETKWSQPAAAAPSKARRQSSSRQTADVAKERSREH